jgi:hypothetical protein
MSEKWKKSRAEQEMLNHEKKKMKEWQKMKFHNFKTLNNERQYSQELKDMGLSDEQCTSVLEWINTLSIHITGVNNIKCVIEDGVVKVTKYTE